MYIMAKKKDEETFIKVTNREVYDAIMNLNENLSKFSKENSEEHTQIILRQDRTNGNVKLSKWIATTALSLVLVTITILLNRIAQAGVLK